MRLYNKWDTDPSSSPGDGNREHHSVTIQVNYIKLTDFIGYDISVNPVSTQGLRCQATDGKLTALK